MPSKPIQTLARRPRLAREYLRRLASITAKYEDCIAPDDGFGLTPSQGTSIVNTTEVLFLFYAARRNNIATGGPVVRRAVSYLVRNLPAHCVPRTATGGRGEKTRFVSFSLFGLSLWPDLLDAKAYETIEWGLDWYESNLLEDGLPELAGSRDVSLFQNAAAVQTLTSLLGIKLPTRNGERATRILTICLQGLLYHSLGNGSWPHQTYRRNPSPAKTALASIALAIALANKHLDDIQDVGGAVAGRHQVEIGTFLDQSSSWLAKNTGRWEGYIEADPDVTGTQWHHLAYALGLEGLVRTGRAFDERSCGAWRALLNSWDPSFSSWCEPTHPPLPTARADYSAVRVFEALAAQYGVDGFDELERRLAHWSSGQNADAGFDLVCSPIGQYLLQPVAQQGHESLLQLSRKQGLMIDALVQASPALPGFIRTEDLAIALVVASSSIGQLVNRTNESVAGQIGGEFRLIESRRGRGYRLAVRSIRQTE